MLLPLNFLRLPLRERSLRWRAWRAVLGFRLVLWIFPLPRIRSWLERAPRGAKPFPAAPAVSAVRIGQIVAAAGRFVPRSTCLVQALAAQWLLRREGFEPELHIGVWRAPNGGFAAHAWVQCDGIPIVGGGEAESYTPILRWEGR